MPRDLPRKISSSTESAVAPASTASTKRGPQHLSVIAGANTETEPRMTRGQVAARLNISVSTVRRYENDKLHPTIDEHGVRWFDETEVAALAATLANEGGTKRSGSAATNAVTVEPRAVGELAALVFERFEQRQSMAEIVIGLRVDPDTVRALYEQWCLGLVEGQLRLDREPRMPRADEIERVGSEKLAARLAALPANELTRISVARYREAFQHGEYEYPRVHELGGFHIAGPCSSDEITGRYGPGSYRVTAYGFTPCGLRWEVLVDGLQGEHPDKVEELVTKEHVRRERKRAKASDGEETDEGQPELALDGKDDDVEEMSA